MKSSTARLILSMKSDGESEGEQMLSMAKEANVLDLVEKACQVENINGVIVVSNSKDMVRLLKDHPVISEHVPDLGSLSFGELLGSIIEKHVVRTFLYMGGGSGVFIDVEDMARMTEAALAFPEILVVNNFYSTDFAAFGRDVELKPLRQCQRDNQVGWILGRKAGARTRVLPSSLGTRFDLDTPTDLMILKIRRPGGRHLSALVSRLSLDLSRLLRVMDVLVHREKEAVIMGRIPPDVASFFDRETACHLRFYIEERGMETRERRKEIWSLVGTCLESLGIPQLFHILSTHAHAGIIDSRLLFHHLGLRPSRQDRFFSDLFQPDEIVDTTVRSFTEEAIEAPVPWVLGGHTLVSGGLYALAEAAWENVREPLQRDFEEVPNRKWDTYQRL